MVALRGGSSNKKVYPLLLQKRTQCCLQSAGTPLRASLPRVQQVWQQRCCSSMWSQLAGSGAGRSSSGGRSTRGLHCSSKSSTNPSSSWIYSSGSGRIDCWPLGVSGCSEAAFHVAEEQQQQQQRELLADRFGSFVGSSTLQQQQQSRCLRLFSLLPRSYEHRTLLFQVRHFSTVVSAAHNASCAAASLASRPVSAAVPNPLCLAAGAGAAWVTRCSAAGAAAAAARTAPCRVASGSAPALSTTALWLPLPHMPRQPVFFRAAVVALPPAASAASTAVAAAVAANATRAIAAAKTSAAARGGWGGGRSVNESCGAASGMRARAGRQAGAALPRDLQQPHLRLKTLGRLLLDSRDFSKCCFGTRAASVCGMLAVTRRNNNLGSRPVATATSKSRSSSDSSGSTFEANRVLRGSTGCDHPGSSSSRDNRVSSRSSSNTATGLGKKAEERKGGEGSEDKADVAAERTKADPWREVEPSATAGADADAGAASAGKRNFHDASAAAEATTMTALYSEMQLLKETVGRQTRRMRLLVVLGACGLVVVTVNWRTVRRRLGLQGAAVLHEGMRSQQLQFTAREFSTQLMGGLLQDPRLQAATQRFVADLLEASEPQATAVGLRALQGEKLQCGVRGVLTKLITQLCNDPAIHEQLGRLLLNVIQLPMVVDGAAQWTMEELQRQDLHYAVQRFLHAAVLNDAGIRNGVGDVLQEAARSILGNADILASAKEFAMQVLKDPELQKYATNLLWAVLRRVLPRWIVGGSDAEEATPGASAARAAAGSAENNNGYNHSNGSNSLDDVDRAKMEEAAGSISSRSSKDVSLEDMRAPADQLRASSARLQQLRLQQEALHTAVKELLARESGEVLTIEKEKLAELFQALRAVLSQVEQELRVLQKQQQRHLQLQQHLQQAQQLQHETPAQQGEEERATQNSNAGQLCEEDSLSTFQRETGVATPAGAAAGAAPRLSPVADTQRRPGCFPTQQQQQLHERVERRALPKDPNKWSSLETLSDGNSCQNSPVRRTSMETAGAAATAGAHADRGSVHVHRGESRAKDSNSSYSDNNGSGKSNKGDSDNFDNSGSGGKTGSNSSGGGSSGTTTSSSGGSSDGSSDGVNSSDNSSNSSSDSSSRSDSRSADDGGGNTYGATSGGNSTGRSGVNSSITSGSGSSGTRTSGGSRSHGRAPKAANGRQLVRETPVNCRYLGSGRSEISSYCSLAALAAAVRGKTSQGVEPGEAVVHTCTAARHDAAGKGAEAVFGRSPVRDGRDHFVGVPEVTAHGETVAGAATGGKAHSAVGLVEREGHVKEETVGMQWRCRYLWWKAVTTHCDTVREKQRRLVLQLQDPQLQRKLQQQLSCRRAARAGPRRPGEEQLQQQENVSGGQRTNTLAGRELAAIWSSTARALQLCSRSAQSYHSSSELQHRPQPLLLLLRRRQHAERDLATNCFSNRQAQGSVAAALQDLFRVHRDLVGVRAAASTARRVTRGVDVFPEGGDGGLCDAAAPMLHGTSGTTSVPSEAPLPAGFAHAASAGTLASPCDSSGCPLLPAADGCFPTEEPR